jgi:hypothetical protein
VNKKGAAYWVLRKIKNRKGVLKRKGKAKTGSLLAFKVLNPARSTQHPALFFLFFT